MTNSHVNKVAIISSHGRSLIDFRGALIERLLSKGIEVYAMAPNLDEQTKTHLIKLGAKPIDISLSRVGMNPCRDILDLLDIYMILRKLEVEVVLGYFIKPVIYGMLAAWLAKAPRRVALIEGLGYVFTHTTKALSIKYRFLRLLVSLLYRISLGVAEKVIFLNPDDRAEFISLGLVKNDKSICIGGIGVDLNKWSLAPAPYESVTFLMVARLLREKGVFEYAEAAKCVKLKYPETKFVLLGGLDENPGSIQLNQISAWNEQGVLTWHGYVSVVEYMKTASVYVLPSYREGVPVSTMEAMAMGRPIITTDVPGCRETVVDGVNGFMVPAKDVLKLAEKMIWFIENPSAIPTMGAASRMMAEEKFDVHKINAKLMKIILGDDDEKTV